jgi:hypothetical protein
MLHTSHVTRYTSHVTRHTSHVTRHTSHVTRHTSHVTRHTSHVTRHTSHVTPWLQAAVQMASDWDKAHARVVDALEALGKACLLLLLVIVQYLLLFIVAPLSPASHLLLGRHGDAVSACARGLKVCPDSPLLQVTCDVLRVTCIVTTFSHILSDSGETPKSIRQNKGVSSYKRITCPSPPTTPPVCHPARKGKRHLARIGGK